MSVQYMQGCAASLRGLMVSIDRHISVEVHGPHSARSRLGHSSRLKIGTLGGLLSAFNCSEYVFAMDMLAESRLAFRQGHAVQPWQWLGLSRWVVIKTSCRKKALVQLR